MPQTKTQKPEYLDLLNTICLGEHQAGVYLQTWSDKTRDPALKHCLNLVAARETSHHHIFKRRIEELGFELQMEVPARFGERMQIATYDMTDSEKIKALDIFDEVQQRHSTSSTRERYTAAMEDEAVDPLTRSLLRWWRDVEADSIQLLRETFAKVEVAG